MVSEFDLKEVSSKLDKIIRLLALDVAKGRELKDQVKFLDQAGFRPKEIAEILGKTPNAIRVTLFTIKKVKGKRIETKLSS